jgi:arylsulfate sulfotransferase
MCPALTIKSGTTFTPASVAPLAGVLHLTTDVDCRVSVAVTDGTNNWQRNFLVYSTNQNVTLLGFKPARSNFITVTVRDKHRNAVTLPQPLVFKTPALPSTMPPIVLLTNQPAKMEPGYTLFRGQNNGGAAYVIIVDQQGEVVWYASLATVLDVRQLANGDLFIPLITTMNEINMLGQTVKTWTAPSGYSINNHEGVPTDHGTILYFSDFSRVVTNFPSSSTVSNAPAITTNVLYQKVVEISATNSSYITNWSTIDMLDPHRISYLTFTYRNALGWDWGHANAIIEDPRDNSLIVSMRHQNAIIKFSRATGALKWILGPPENWGPQFQPYLLKPVGIPFAWNYSQHAPEITPQGTLLFYDNGNYRASPFAASITDSNNYSRAVEFDINEETMEVSQVWEYGSSDTSSQRLFTWSVGDADWMKQSGNVLITFGNTTYVNGLHPSPVATNSAMARIIEVTHDPIPEVVFDLALFSYTNTSPTYAGCFVYRSDRIPDLYSVLPPAVADLTIENDHGNAHLMFSGSESHTYTVESSTDLEGWEAIGIAEPSGDGNFDFIDAEPIREGRYYRVATH